MSVIYLVPTVEDNVRTLLFYAQRLDKTPFKIDSMELSLSRVHEKLDRLERRFGKCSCDQNVDLKKENLVLKTENNNLRLAIKSIKEGMQNIWTRNFHNELQIDEAPKSTEPPTPEALPTAATQDTQKADQVEEQLEHIVQKETQQDITKTNEIQNQQDTVKKKQDIQSTNQKESIQSTNQMVSIQSTNQKVSIQSTNQKVSIQPTNQKVSIQSTNQKGSIQSANQKESIQSTNQKMIIQSTNQKESIQSTNQKESIQSTNQKESILSTNQKETQQAVQMILEDNAEPHNEPNLVSTIQEDVHVDMCSDMDLGLLEIELGGEKEEPLIQHVEQGIHIAEQGILLPQQSREQIVEAIGNFQVVVNGEKLGLTIQNVELSASTVGKETQHVGKSAKEQKKPNVTLKPKDNKFSCHICKQTFNKECFLTTHMKGHAGKGKQSDKNGKQVKEINEVIQEEIPSSEVSGQIKKEFECGFCERTFKTKTLLSIHMRRHTGEKPFKCSLCSVTFSKKSEHDAHLRTHKGTKVYECEVCHKTFAHKKNLTEHANMVHSTVRPFKCDICDKCFKQESGLKQHLMVHNGVKPYPCKICNRNFTQKANLYKHIDCVHKKVKPYGCSICYRQFSYKNNLEAHVRLHLNVRPYQCSVCGKAFPSRSQVNMHIKSIHVTEADKQQCEFCEKWYNSRIALGKHKNVKHRGEDLNSINRCNFCRKRFPSQLLLENHLKLHTEEGESNSEAKAQ